MPSSKEGYQDAPRAVEGARGDVRLASPTALVVLSAAGGYQVAMGLAALVVARNLAPVAYGQVAYFFSVVGVVVMIGSLGLRTQITTEVARLVGSGRITSVTDVVMPFATARIATIVVLFGLCGLAAALGDRIAAIAGAAGGLSLMAGFGLGIAEGLGRARLVAILQLSQALLYLGVVATWANAIPERVYVAVVGCYAVVAAAAFVASRGVFSAWDLAARLSWARWRSVVHPSGRVYVLTMLLAPYGALAALVLGGVGKYEDAALVSVALALILLPSTVVAMLVTIHYYPRLCQLVAGQASDTAGYVDEAFRLCAALGISVAVILAVYARDVISLMYTEKYLASVGPLTGMAPGAGLLVVGQLVVWTLWAHNQLRWALAGALAQLIVLVAAVAITIARPGLPLTWLGIGHTVAVATGCGVWGAGLKRLGKEYTWHSWRLLTAGSLALVVCELINGVTPSPADRLAAAALLALEATLVSTVSLTVLIPGWSGRLLAWLRTRNALPA